ATDSGALRRLISEKKRHRALAETFDASSIKHFLFSVNWVVRKEGLPLGMGDLVLLDGDAELGPVLVQLFNARRTEGKEDESTQVLCAAAFVPARTRELGEAHLAHLADRISASLEQLMPFVKKYLVLKSAPYLDAGGLRGSRLMPHPLHAFDMEQFLG